MANTANLLASRNTYNRYYGDFRGVDFSSDHTQVKDTRLAYAVNMWKDYNSGMGETLETIPGFRQKMSSPYFGEVNKTIYGIHSFKTKNINGEEIIKVFFHSGKQLFNYDTYPEDTGVPESMEITIPKARENIGGTPYYVIELTYPAEFVENISYGMNGDITSFATATGENEITITNYNMYEGDVLSISHAYEQNETVPEVHNTASNGMPVYILYAIDIDKLQGVFAIDGEDLTPYITRFSDGRFYLITDKVQPGDIIRTRYAGLVDEVAVPEVQYEGGLNVYDIILPFSMGVVSHIYTRNGEDLTLGIDAGDLFITSEITITTSAVKKGDIVYLFYQRYVPNDWWSVHYGMNEAKSTSFVMNNRLYIIDGANFLVCEPDGEGFFWFNNVAENAYIPTTYINIVPGGENADAGTEYEQRNMLSPYFKHTFIGDGQTRTYYMNEGELEEITEISINGETQDTTNGVTIDLTEGKITFNTAPPAPNVQGAANVIITAKKTLTKIQGVTENANLAELITHCTVAAIYDDRLFLTGNPDLPNHVFYCERNSTGYADPTYFGVLNYVQDGVGNTPNTAMLAVADTLMVLKSDTQQDGSVYFHAPLATESGVQPKVYPGTRGLAGTGCIGAAINFLDDPVFVSRYGLEAVGQLSVRYERAIEHRSSLVDAKLTACNLKDAVLEEWNGYLVLLTEGKIFLADSRQRYTDNIGNVQYEWYYLEDIGTYVGQYTEYRYAEKLSTGLEGKTVKYCTRCGKGARQHTCGEIDAFIDIPLSAAENVYFYETDETRDLRGAVANPPDEEGNATKEVFDEILDFDDGVYAYPVGIYYTVHDVLDRITGEHVRYEAYVCESRGAQTGGVFSPATTIKNIDGVLYFGTENGYLFAFNTDKRDEDGTIAPKWYTFDGRAIYSGCATKMDNCGIPHLTKSTVKKSTVIRTKTFHASAAKIKVRTNKKLYEQVGRINSMRFSFEDMDFSDFSFATTEQNHFVIKEKEKKWMEKQYFIYSDEYQKPFALYYISYRYVIAGRYKE